MNISSNIASTQPLLFFKKSILPLFTDQNKKICILVAAIFASLGACYMLRHFFSLSNKAPVVENKSSKGSFIIPRESHESDLIHTLPPHDPSDAELFVKPKGRNPGQSSQSHQTPSSLASINQIPLHPTQHKFTVSFNNTPPELIPELEKCLEKIKVTHPDVHLYFQFLISRLDHDLVPKELNKLKSDKNPILIVIADSRGTPSSSLLDKKQGLLKDVKEEFFHESVVGFYSCTLVDNGCELIQKSELLQKEELLSDIEAQIKEFKPA